MPLSVAVDRRWRTRFATGWRLSLSCLSLMRSEPGLVLVPVTTTAIILVELVVAALIGRSFPSVLAVLWWLAVGVVATTVAVSGQAVIVHRVGMLVRGHRVASNRESFQAVRPLLVELSKWSAMTFAVGVAVRLMERTRGPLGWALRIVAIAVTVGWSALTFFVLPVMVFEGLGARAAIGRSRAIVRDNWGEGVVGVGVLNVVFNVVWLGVFVLCLLLAAAHLLLLAVLLVIASILAFNLLAAVASPVFAVLLYNFALSRELAFDFSVEDLTFVFRRRREARV